MSFKISGCKFFHLPVGNATGTAHSLKPFVSEPACRPAVSGISNHKGFIAVGHDPGLISDSVNRLNSMQQTFARRPEFYFFNESKKFNPLAIEAFSRFFSWFLFYHDIRSPGDGLGAGSIFTFILPQSFILIGWYDVINECLKWAKLPKMSKIKETLRSIWFLLNWQNTKILAHFSSF